MRERGREREKRQGMKLLETDLFPGRTQELRAVFSQNLIQQQLKG